MSDAREAIWHTFYRWLIKKVRMVRVSPGNSKANPSVEDAVDSDGGCVSHEKEARRLLDKYLLKQAIRNILEAKKKSRDLPHIISSWKIEQIMAALAALSVTSFFAGLVAQADLAEFRNLCTLIALVSAVAFVSIFLYRHFAEATLSKAINGLIDLLDKIADYLHRLDED